MAFEFSDKESFEELCPYCFSKDLKIYDIDVLPRRVGEKSHIFIYEKLNGLDYPFSGRAYCHRCCGWCSIWGYEKKVNLQSFSGSKVFSCYSIRGAEPSIPLFDPRNEEARVAEALMGVFRVYPSGPREFIVLTRNACETKLCTIFLKYGECSKFEEFRKSNYKDKLKSLKIRGLRYLLFDAVRKCGGIAAHPELSDVDLVKASKMVEEVLKCIFEGAGTDESSKLAAINLRKECKRLRKMPVL